MKPYFPQLHLQEGGLHADINGDGVLDHVQVHVPPSMTFILLKKGPALFPIKTTENGCSSL